MIKISKFGLKNFRVFKDFMEFDLSPMMVLTGPNNSGKSSLIKALLLLHANEDVINDEIPSIRKVKYYNGTHSLGNHKLTLNDSNEKTIYSFTFQKNYRLLIEINIDGSFANNYKIVDEDNNIVICEGSKFLINFSRLTKYFNERLRDVELEIKNEYSDSDEVAFEKYKYDNLLLKLDECQFPDEEIEFDLYSMSDIDEDTLDLEWYESIISVVKRLTGIKLYKDEILLLVPFAESGYFRFNQLVYVPTIREKFRRAYSEYDNYLIQSIIKTRLFNKNLYSYDELNEKITAQLVEKWENLSILEQMNVSMYLRFIQNWVHEFEIGNELTYGYDENKDTYYINLDGKSLLEYGAGYGQIIYILLALANEVNAGSVSKPKRSKVYFPSTYILEEPETSLHPAFQSKLAEMIVDAQKTFGVNFIIETHSEYMIRKFQYLTANKVVKVGDIGIYYFHLPNKTPENEKQIKKIDIDECGGLSDDFGPGFIDEATNLKYDLIRLNKNNKN